MKKILTSITARFRPRDLVALGLIILVCAGVFGFAGAAFLPAASETIDRQIVNDDYDALTAPIGTALDDRSAPQNEVRQRIEARGRLYGVRLLLTNFSHVAHGTLILAVLDEAGNTLTGCSTDMTELLDNTFHTFIFDTMLDAGDGAAYTLVLTAAGDGPEDVVALHKSASMAAGFVEEDQDAPAYPLAGFVLTENGQPQQGTLALQYVVRYAGGANSFLYTAYPLFAVLLTVFLLALYLLVFVLKWPAHRLFVVCGLALGLVFMFLIPPLTAPDEYTHVAAAYQYSNLLLGTDLTAEHENILTVRAGDEMLLGRYDFTATDVFAYQRLYEGLLARAPQDDPVGIFARAAGGFPLMHAAPTLGVLLARLLGLGKVGLLLLGRLANLIFYTVLVSRAIKRLPLAKPMMFCAGLLPSALQLAASFSYDAYAIALAFYVTAFALQLALSGRPATVRQLVGLGAAAVLLAPAKAVYAALLAVVVFLPARCFGPGRAAPAGPAGVAGPVGAANPGAAANAEDPAKPMNPARPANAAGSAISAKNRRAAWPRRRLAFCGGVLACALAVWLWGNWGAVAANLQGVLGAAADTRTAVTQQTTEDAGPADTAGAAADPQDTAGAAADPQDTGGTTEPARAAPPADPEGDTPAESWTHAETRFTPGYVLRNPGQTVKMLGLSLWNQSALWLQGLLGGRLGEQIAITLEVSWPVVIAMLLCLLAAAVPNREDALVLPGKARLGLGAVAAVVAALLLAVAVMWTPTDYAELFGFQGRYLLPLLPLVLLALRGRALGWKKNGWRAAAFAMPCLVVAACLQVFVQVIGR